MGCHGACTSAVIARPCSCPQSGPPCTSVAVPKQHGAELRKWPGLDYVGRPPRPQNVKWLDVDCYTGGCRHWLLHRNWQVLEVSIFLHLHAIISAIDGLRGRLFEP